MAKKRKLRAADMPSLTKAAECLKVLAHPVRIRMVQLLLHGRYNRRRNSRGLRNC